MHPVHECVKQLYTNPLMSRFVYLPMKPISLLRYLGIAKYIPYDHYNFK